MTMRQSALYVLCSGLPPPHFPSFSSSLFARSRKTGRGAAGPPPDGAILRDIGVLGTHDRRADPSRSAGVGCPPGDGQWQAPNGKTRPPWNRISRPPVAAARSPANKTPFLRTLRSYGTRIQPNWPQPPLKCNLTEKVCRVRGAGPVAEAYLLGPACTRDSCQPRIGGARMRLTISFGGRHRTDTSNEPRFSGRKRAEHPPPLASTRIRRFFTIRA